MERAAVLVFLLSCGGALPAEASPSAPRTCQGVFVSTNADFKKLVIDDSMQMRKDRSLDDYERELEVLDYRAELQQLPKSSIYVDIGAGHALALREFLQESPPSLNLRAVAIDVVKPRDPKLDAALRANRGRFKYIHGDDLVGLKNSGHLQSLMGKADLVTDVMAAGSYAPDLSSTLEGC